jgi:tyrosyl-tRNA synthetase
VKQDAEHVGRGQLDPRSWKDSLARNIVAQYHGPEKAEAAAQDEREIHLSGGSVAPEGTPEHRVSLASIPLLDLLLESGLVPSKGEGRRLVRNGGIKISGQKTENELETITVTDGMVLQAGKKGFRILRTG